MSTNVHLEVASNQEIEEDKRRDGTTVPSSPLQEPSSPSSLPDQPATSPAQQSTSPSVDSGLASPASSIEKHGDDGGGGKDAQDGERVGSGGSRRKQESVPKSLPSVYQEPSSMKMSTETLEIDLHTTGTGLGFGVMNFPGIGVTIKTILPNGVAGTDGRLHSGDLLLEINGLDVEKKTRDEVYSILKECQGEVKLVVSREVIQVPVRGPPPQKREGQRRGPPKEATRPKRENDKMVREQKVKRKVTLRGNQQEDLLISVENDQGKPSGRGGGGGGGGGRGRGRTVRISKEEVKRREFEVKQKDNYDRVEAEIAAMREALENQKATGAADPPSKSVYSFLDDPSRYGADPQYERPAKGNQHSGGRRQQQNRVGQESDTGGGRGRKRDQRGRGGYSQGRGAASSNTETTVTMSGKERREYEAWKREREKIDQDRIRRHKQSTGDQGMQWNPAKEQAAAEDEWEGSISSPAKQEQGDQGEMRIGHWDATDAVTNQRDKRGGAGHFEHDDRVKGQTPDHEQRIGSGRFTHEGNQRGRGGGREFYRGGRGSDRGRRGRGGGSGPDQSRPGRRTSPQNPQNESQNNFQGDAGRQRTPGLSSPRDESFGQWQQSSGSDWNAGGSTNNAQWEGDPTKALRDTTESLHIGPLPSPSPTSDGVKSPRSPASPFTPTGHTFVKDWATEVEARHPDGSFSAGNDLVYSNSKTNQSF